MRPLVGWYIHHHGAGHLTRFLAVRPHLDADVVVFSSMAEPSSLPASTTWVSLPRDDEPTEQPDGTLLHPRDASPTMRGLLHWAPLRHPGHTNRLAQIATHIGAHTFAAFVVDVSAEVAVLVRLLGVPPILMAQPGERTDEPHRLAYTAAELVIAPWPEGAHSSRELRQLADRVTYVGGISRFEGRATPTADRSGVLFLGGGGAVDTARISASLDDAALAVPNTPWTALGISGTDHFDGTPWTADPWPQLTAAEIVVSWAGQNSIADLAAAGARAVIIPQSRPFQEQVATGRTLSRIGLATVLTSWPAASEWPSVIERARGLTPRWGQWEVDGAAARAAAAIEEVAR
ncbi:MAG: hypothetical protein JWQ43_1738 [Glaciihabitans sp.]|nr:hypothetical protein [Glaciihabitans sp.]